MQKFISKKQINKGWSDDKKYCVVDDSATKYFLREVDIQKYPQKKYEIKMMQHAGQLGVSIPQLVDIEINHNISILYSWIEGKDLRDVLTALSLEQQNKYGIEAGLMLKKIHRLPIEKAQNDWSDFFNHKIDVKIANYNQCLVKYEYGEKFIDYINAHRYLLKNRPQCFQHGDYHVGNMMLDKKGKLYIIDFDRYDIGDPWEEFNRIVWSAQTSPAFAQGLINGYFDYHVPLEFWQLLALYISSNTLSSLPWAINYNPSQIDIMKKQAKEILAWYDNMNTVIPNWYK